MAPSYDEETEEEEEEEVEEEMEEEDEPPPPPPPPPVKRSSKKQWKVRICIAFASLPHVFFSYPKDPTKPKRAMSAYFLFSQANRALIKEQNPEAGFGDIAKIISARYKELTEKESRKWAKKAEEDKIRYQEEMKQWVPQAEPGEGRKPKAKKDPNAPKRNMSAYFLFSIAARPRVKEENPEANFGELARIISAEYNAMTEAELEVWKEKAKLDKVRYQEEMRVYKGE